MNVAFNRKILCGAEHEVGLMTDDGVEYDQMLVKVPASTFLPNGGRAYHDGTAEDRTHYHLEGATPECGDPYSLVAYTAASLLDLKRRLPDHVNLMLNNVDASGRTWGAHENYLCSVEAFEQQLDLAPHLATRIIFTGSGYRTRQDIDVFSSRFEFLTHLTSDKTTVDRGILNGRDESHTSDIHFKRLHIISGDANLLQKANFLKFGTTALVVKLIEDKKLPKDARLSESPLAFGHKLNDSMHHFVRTGVKSAEINEALRIQRAYLQAVTNAYGNSREPWVNELITLWRQTLERLETDPSQLVDTVDWVAKYYCINELYDIHGNWPEKDPQGEFWHVDLVYSNFSGDFWLEEFIAEQGGNPYLFDPKVIEQSITTPPTSTRAYARGHAIQIANTNGIEVTPQIGSEWQELNFRSIGGEYRLSLPDPQDPSNEALDEFKQVFFLR